MPLIPTDDGCLIHAEVEGLADAPVLMLSNSLGTDLHMWDQQAPELSRHFRLVRYDRRGHGKSSASKTRGSMERLGRDVLAVVDALKIDRFNWCGLSMGGMVGQWLAANAPEHVQKLVLSNTHYYYPDKSPWDERIRIASEQGVATLAPVQIQRWFTQQFISAHPEVVDGVARMFASTGLDGYVACCEAGRDMDFRSVSPRIKAQTLIIVGSEDKATPPSAGEDIHRMIKNSSIVTIDAAHLSNVEKPQAYIKALLDFLL
ncbi:MAG: 3-oxoadipate enol-lactonase [Pseudorhodoplanes sp.]